MTTLEPPRRGNEHVEQALTFLNLAHQALASGNPSSALIHAGTAEKALGPYAGDRRAASWMACAINIPEEISKVADLARVALGKDVRAAVMPLLASLPDAPVEPPPTEDELLARSGLTQTQIAYAKFHRWLTQQGAYAEDLDPQDGGAPENRVPVAALAPATSKEGC